MILQLHIVWVFLLARGLVLLANRADTMVAPPALLLIISGEFFTMAAVPEDFVIPIILVALIVWIVAWVSWFSGLGFRAFVRIFIGIGLFFVNLDWRPIFDGAEILLAAQVPLLPK